MNNNAFWAFLLSLAFSSAKSQGILFEHGLTWQAVLQKAKLEDKFVFVDCYATWCGPCKWMAKMIYPIDSVGVFMNKRFISVKVQMDTTKLDNDDTRQWYVTARTFGDAYHINGYPSYLFFSSEGEAVHKDMGGKNINDFLSMGEAAMDPKQQYYRLLAEYDRGILTFPLFPVLVDEASRIGQDSLSKQVCRDYLLYYLDTISESTLWTRDNIAFINRYSSFIGISDKIFRLYYRNKTTIDSVVESRGFSDGLVNELIYRDKVKPLIDKSLECGKKPNWHRLEKEVAKNYDLISAKKNVLQGRVEFYKSKKRWGNYVKYFIRQQELNGIESWQPGSGIASWDLNNNAYEVFEYSTQKRELEMALSWVNRALTDDNRFNPAFMDTKANLLYKLGNKADALILEEKSHALLPKNSGITANYEKMRGGLPTWQTE